MGGGGGGDSGGAQTPADIYAQQCENANATYTHRVNVEDAFNWCTIHHSGADVILLAGVAVLLAVVFRGRWSMMITLVLGFVCQTVLIYVNYAPHLSNSFAWWLGIEPFELFFYIFLPPLIFEAAVRIYVFQFKKVLSQVLVLAFVVVIASAALLIPIMLYVFNLRSNGWQWQHVALFGAMIGPTDAVAILSVMKRFSGITKIRNTMEGESLLNDASSITLFIVLLGQVDAIENGTADSAWSVIGTITWKMIVLAVGGAGIGLALGVLMHLLMKWLARTGTGRDVMLALTLAGGYLSFYIANSPCKVSGVISGAVFGLYGAATNLWDGGAQLEDGGAFDAFWDTMAYVVNAIVFYYSGVVIANFTVRASDQIFADETAQAYLTTILLSVPVWLSIFLCRFAMLFVCRPLYWLCGTDFNMREIGFVTFAGIRGSTTLIMCQAVVVQLATREGETFVKAQMVLFATLVVVFTLLIQAPMLTLVLRMLRLGVLPKERLDMRRRAVIELARGTGKAIRELKNDKDEMLKGVNWEQVTCAVGDVADDLGEFTEPGSKPERPWVTSMRRFLGRCMHCCGMRKSSAAAAPGGFAADGPCSSGGGRGGGGGGAGQEDELSELAKHVEEDATTIVMSGGGGGGRARSITGDGVLFVSGFEEPQAAKEVLERASSAFGRTKHKVDVQRQTRRKAIRNPSGFHRNPSGFHQNPAKSLGAATGSTSTSTIDEAREGSGSGLRLLQQRVKSFGYQGDRPLRAIPSREPSSDMDDISTDSRGHAQAPTPWQQLPRPGQANGHGGAPTAGARAAVMLSRQTSASTSMPHSASVPDGMHMRAFDSALSIVMPPSAADPTSRATTSSGSGRTGAAGGGDGDGGQDDIPFQEHHETQLTLTRRTKAIPGLVLDNCDMDDSDDGAHGGRDGGGSGGASDKGDREGGGKADEDDVMELQLRDLRVRLATGLKHHFHTKHTEGLLTSKSQRLLNFACNILLDSPEKPLRLWEDVQQGQATSQLLNRTLSRIVIAMRRASLWLKARRRVRWALRPIIWLLGVVTGWLLDYLSKKMSRACEVAIEFELGLIHSPLVKWLYDTHASRKLSREVAEEVQKVDTYINDRELEAPDRFRAIQTYRAKLAIFHKQLLLVDNLFAIGMLDEGERDVMREAVERRERKTLNRGPVVEPATLKGVLRNLPFLRYAPKDVVQLVLKAGRLVEYMPQTVVMTEDNVDYLWVVVQGVVKLTYSFNVANKIEQEYYLSTGHVFGLYNVVAGRTLPGGGKATAMRRSLGQGPVLFKIHKKAVQRIEQLAEGDVGFAQVHLDMHRIAAMYAMDRLKPFVLQQLAVLLQVKAKGLPDPEAHQQHQHQGGGTSSSTPGLGVTEDREAAARARLTSLFSSDDADDDDSPTPFQQQQQQPPATAASLPQLATVSAFPGMASSQQRQQQLRGRSSEGDAGVGVRSKQQQLRGRSSESDAGVGGGGGGGGRPRLSTISDLSGLSMQRQQRGGGGAGARTSTDMPAEERALLHKCRKRARHVEEELRAHLMDAQLADVQPGAAYIQSTTLMLMRGSLYTDCPVFRDVRGPNVEHLPDGVTTAFRAPCLLPWLWETEADAGPHHHHHAPGDQHHHRGKGQQDPAAIPVGPNLPQIITYRAGEHESARLFYCLDDGSGGQPGAGDTAGHQHTVGMQTVFSLGKTLPKGQDLRTLLQSMMRAQTSMPTHGRGTDHPHRTHTEQQPHSTAGATGDGGSSDSGSHREDSTEDGRGGGGAGGGADEEGRPGSGHRHAAVSDDDGAVPLRGEAGVDWPADDADSLPAEEETRGTPSLGAAGAGASPPLGSEADGGEVDREAGEGEERGLQQQQQQVGGVQHQLQHLSAAEEAGCEGEGSGGQQTQQQGGGQEAPAAAAELPLVGSFGSLDTIQSGMPLMPPSAERPAPLASLLPDLREHDAPPASPSSSPRRPASSSLGGRRRSATDRRRRSGGGGGGGGEAPASGHPSTQASAPAVLDRPEEEGGAQQLFGSATPPPRTVTSPEGAGSSVLQHTTSAAASLSTGGGLARTPTVPELARQSMGVAPLERVKSLHRLTVFRADDLAGG